MTTLDKVAVAAWAAVAGVLLAKSLGPPTMGDWLVGSAMFGGPLATFAYCAARSVFERDE